MNVMKPDSFLNVSDMKSDKAVAAMTSTILSAILTTEMENKTQSVQLVSLTGDVLEFFSAIPSERSATPKGVKISKDEIIELFGQDEVISEVYDYVVENYPGIDVIKVPDKEAVFFFCPRLVMLIHTYENQKLLDLADQLSKPKN